MFRRDESGAAAVEYGLLLAAIAGVVGVLAVAIGHQTRAGLSALCTSIPGSCSSAPPTSAPTVQHATATHSSALHLDISLLWPMLIVGVAAALLVGLGSWAVTSIQRRMGTSRPAPYVSADAIPAQRLSSLIERAAQNSVGVIASAPISDS